MTVGEILRAVLQCHPGRSATARRAGTQEQSAPASGFHLGVEPVAEAVAEEVEGEHGERDGEAGEQDHPGRRLVEIRARARQHQAPGRRRLSHAEPEERQARLEQDGLRHRRRHHDQERGDDVRHDVAQDDAHVAEARGPGGIDEG